MAIEALVTANQKQTSFWVKTESDKEAVRQGCYFDLDSALYVARFLEGFIVQVTSEWAGEPFTLLPWQWFDVVAPLYGWKRPGGLRRFDRFGIGIPKKNGKSTLVAALILYHLIADGEQSNEVYLCAASKEQAKIVYRESSKFIAASPKLRACLDPKDYHAKILSRLDPSFIQVLSGEAPAKHGFNAGFVLFDEFHEQRDRVFWNTMRYAGEARPQPLVGWISTQGFDVDRPWVEQWEYARGVQSGSIVDIGYLGVVYEAHEDDDFKDPAVWKRANPSMGEVLDPIRFGEKLAEAEKEGPTALRDFRILRLNQRVKPGTLAISRDVWDTLAEPGIAIPEDEPCYGGLDLAETRDMNALVLTAWDGRRVIHEAHFAYPEAFADKEQTNKDLFDKWTAGGWIHRTPGNSVDPDALVEWILGILKKRRLRKLQIDPSRAGYVWTKLQDAGIKVERFSQSHGNYNAPYRDWEKFVQARRVVHQGSPVMSWMWGNLVLDQNRYGLVRPERPKARHLKIDGVPATLMSFAELFKHIPQERGEFSGW